MSANTKKILGIAAVAAVVALLAIWMGLKSGDSKPPRPADTAQPDLSLVNRPDRRTRRAQRRKSGEVSRGPAPKLASSTTEESQELLKLLNAALDSGEEERIAGAILSSPHLETPELVQFALYGLDKIDSADYRRDLVSAVQGSSAKMILPVLAKAMKDSAPEVRQAAIAAMSSFNEVREDTLDEAVEEWTSNTTEDEQKAREAYEAKLAKLAELLTTEDYEVVREMLTAALNDDDKEVRREALSTMRRLAYELKLIGLDAAIDSKYKDVVLDGLRQIVTGYTKDTLLTAMEALNNRDEDIFYTAQEYVNRLVGKEFNSYDEAVRWWNDNAYKYDFDLVKITDGSIPDEELYSD